MRQDSHEVVPIKEWLDQNVDRWSSLSVGLLTEIVWRLWARGAFVDLITGHEDPVFLFNKPFNNIPSKVGNYYSKVIVDRGKSGNV